ncbi:MAG: hypothetical protein WAV05_14065 [Anaerolineales bacterium]
MAMDDLDQVIALDNDYFGAERSFFLQRRFTLFPELCKVSILGKRIIGYIMGRAGETWVSAGPWVMEYDHCNPVELLETIAIEAGDRPISMGILESNHQACDSVLSLGFSVGEDSPWRMAKGDSSDLGGSSQCYAVGSAAKG